MKAAPNNKLTLSQRFLASINKLFASQKGVSLVEVSVTVVILSILATVGVVMFSAAYQTVQDTEQRLDQINRGGQALGAVNALLAQTDPNNLGLTTTGLPSLTAPGGATIPSTPAGILPPSLSGKQLTLATGSSCYRIFYRQESLWMAVASNCSDLARPVTGLQRGPEQYPGETFSAASALYDPVLDLTANSQQRVVNGQFTAYPLVTGIKLLGNNPLFSYKFLDLSTAATSATGNLGENLPFYTAGNDQRASLVGVEMQFAVSANNGSISDKEYRQVLFVGQSS